MRFKLKFYAFYIIFLVFLGKSFVYLFDNYPVYFVSEGPIEYLQHFILVISILFLMPLIKRKKKYLYFILFLSFVFMEEINWGQNFFLTEKYFCKINFQLSFHNISHNDLENIALIPFMFYLIFYELILNILGKINPSLMLRLTIPNYSNLFSMLVIGIIFVICFFSVLIDPANTEKFDNVVNEIFELLLYTVFFIYSIKAYLNSYAIKYY
ncbi:MAG: hypothetical protein ACD_79C01535G0006 [uncultured bacterium]|nr:MAG: hypothetical protein ACD_79C01535G0006 [uncultured bacterium]